MIVELLLTLAIPLGLDLHLPVPEDNPLTAEKIELGRQLFFWDARSASLEEQAVMPIEDPNELGSSVSEAASRVGLEAPQIARALSSFVRSILSGNSPFDRFINGERTALTADEWPPPTCTTAACRLWTTSSRSTTAAGAAIRRWIRRFARSV